MGDTSMESGVLRLFFSATAPASGSLAAPPIHPFSDQTGDSIRPCRTACAPVCHGDAARDAALPAPPKHRTEFERKTVLPRVGLARSHRDRHRDGQDGQQINGEN